ncbi:copper chaperone PCu(A)C [Yoonia sp.]|jgi:periplasmic copper chaperone A|uniref:copper chaperone PCu(A)C n=1 Tax=Yoonia sp. TaxID=2212373 RepID=UPI004047E626
MKRLMILAALMLPTALFAHDYTVGGLQIIHPAAGATAPTAQAGAGYFQIVNNGDQPDRLIGVTADFPRVMIHTTQMDGDIARMVHLEAVDIPAGETVTFAPGGLHVMFMGLNGDPFETGESFDAVLVFEAAGEVPVTFYVEDISDLTDHSHH